MFGAALAFDARLRPWRQRGRWRRLPTRTESRPRRRLDGRATPPPPPPPLRWELEWEKTADLKYADLRNHLGREDGRAARDDLASLCRRYDVTGAVVDAMENAKDNIAFCPIRWILYVATRIRAMTRTPESG